ncbi:MAG TPA: AI-2E family transporter, partial [Gemmatimonadaceae bacterium]|nr:AI-2E family transporter [Gemmatimonadaceae bacterium]
MVRAAAEGPDDRRRRERRVDARLADLTVPELRRVVITSMLFVVVLALFVWMVRAVIIAAILGAVIAAYLRPLHERLLRSFGRPAPAALLTLVLTLVPIGLLAVYSYQELRDVAAYVDTHEEEIAARIDSTIRTLPVVDGAVTTRSVQRAVFAASGYGAAIPGAVRGALAGFAIGASVFLFTAFYILTQGRAVAAYVRQKIPARYHELTGAIERNGRGVLYGAVYATLVTQALKTAVLFALNVAFGVPLAGVLALVSFVIGFFPVVGSWTVYVPVAGWLLVFRNAPGSAIVMILVGFLVNTVFISTYLRPKLAAERSRVLNFYWMFVGLVTGVYTFGIAGILLGPILIGVLKAIVDAVTATASWRG